MGRPGGKPNARGGPLTRAALVQVRTAVRRATFDLSIVDAMAITRASENTFKRIERLENISVVTLARILEELGYELRIEIRKTQDVVGQSPKTAA